MNPNAVNNLLVDSFNLQSQGQIVAAEKGYRKVLQADPKNVHALNLLGIICMQSGRSEEAVDLIFRANKLQPNDAETLTNLGLALKDVGRFEDAAVNFRKSLGLANQVASTHNNLGNVLASLGKMDEAIASFRSALALQPNYVDCLINLAAALVKTGQYSGAHAAASRAVELNRQSPEAHHALGEVLLKQSRYEDAVSPLQTALALRPNYVDAILGLSNAAKEAGDTARAKQLLLSAVETEPENAHAQNSLGVFLEQNGDPEGAAHHFRLAIASTPGFANPYYQLAQLKGVRLTDEEIAATRKFYDDPNITDEQRAPLAFALACIFEREGKYEESFRYLSVGQAIKAAQGPYDDYKVVEFYGQVQAAFTDMPEAYETDTPFPHAVFVLGMPRSGTSLTEQILASHPDVVGAGELSLMEDTVAEAIRLTGSPFPRCADSLSIEQKRHLRNFYMSRLKKRVESAKFIVDKTPMNFQYVGFIATIMPEAKVIHCRRNPIDNCLSIFKLPFEVGHTYAHNLESLGLHYVRYAGLMKHWSEKMSRIMITVDYEDLVEDLEKNARRMLTHVGLDWNESVLEYYKTDRIVKTPSASQVRKPIYRDSVQLWRRYEAQLGPLIAALDMKSV